MTTKDTPSPATATPATPTTTLTDSFTPLHPHVHLSTPSLSDTYDLEAAAARAISIDSDDARSAIVHRAEFWSSFKGMMLILVLFQAPILTLYGLLIGITHTDFWAARTQAYPIDTLQQILTGVVGLFIAYMVSDFCWTCQGAIASVWAFKKSGTSLIVAEAIQTGVIALVSKTSARWYAKGLVIFLPLCAAIMTFTYKLGVVVDERHEAWEGAIRMRFLRVFLDQENLVLAGCNDTNCRSDILDPPTLIGKPTPHLADYSFAEGIERGTNLSSTAYALDLGDVPSVYYDFADKIRSGLDYSQLFFNSTMDCGRTSKDPYILNCASVGLNAGLKPTDVPAVSGFQLCRPTTPGRLRGSLTLASSDSKRSLDLSCAFDVNVTQRDVTAYFTGSRFNITASKSVPPTPLSQPHLAAIVPLLSAAVPFYADRDIITRGDTACLSGATGEVTCNNDTAFPNFRLEVASRLLRDLNENVWVALQYPRQTPPADAAEPLALTGRFYPSPSTPFERLVGPNSDLSVTARAGAGRFVAGAIAKGDRIKYRFLTVEYWMFGFLFLIVLQLTGAFVKMAHHCHPFEPVGGLVWTLRKIHPDVAKEVHGMQLQDAMNYATTLNLTRVHDATSGAVHAVSITHRADRDTKPRKIAVSTSILAFDANAGVRRPVSRMTTKPAVGGEERATSPTWHRAARKAKDGEDGFRVASAADAPAAIAIRVEEVGGVETAGSAPASPASFKTPESPSSVNAVNVP
ncbi:hypothetical protein HDU96_005499 [Phlyctochytrium bullatum]|nr:hypothetical protein HDU96_005499 [Phlyctochytrium bullatum]